MHVMAPVASAVAQMNRRATHICTNKAVWTWPVYYQHSWLASCIVWLLDCLACAPMDYFVVSFYSRNELGPAP
jgi:hypothetical protein